MYNHTVLFTRAAIRDHFINCNSDTPTKWTELIAADYWNTALVPSSSPPVVVGGDDGKTSTADIKMYNNSNKS